MVVNPDSRLERHFRQHGPSCISVNKPERLLTDCVTSAVSLTAGRSYPGRQVPSSQSVGRGGGRVG